MTRPLSALAKKQEAPRTPEVKQWMRDAVAEIDGSDPMPITDAKILARHYAPEAAKVERLVKTAKDVLQTATRSISVEDLMKWAELRAALEAMK